MCSEWHTHSFFLEVKPRAELASLFIDCPIENFTKCIQEAGESTKKEFVSKIKELDMIRVSEHTIELGIPPIVVENLRLEQRPPRYCASIPRLTLYPQSLCAPTWADNHRLFMCKLHVEADGAPLVPKTFHRLAREICDIKPLEEYCKKDYSKISISCTQCGSFLIDDNSRRITLSCIPCDDWFETSPSADYYCRDSCGISCDPERHSKHHDEAQSGHIHADWLPNSRRFLLSHSYIGVNQESLSDEVISHEEQIVLCKSCNAELGAVVKNRQDIFLLHHSTCTLSTNAKPFLKARFPDTAVFYAQLVLSSCETQSSLKLVVRSLNKTPYLLIWLLDSYIVAASGELHNEDSGESQCEFRPFPAVKMLYKVFDAQSAANDPRANGEDSSVGLINVPFGCCMKLIEHLLLSSHSLPLPCRCVGQFYVGFLKMAESI
ncbi:hypothetical protein DICVIV_05557 [Dictyocaulus viviparus]|uniref:E3 ubiquitin-protein ligase E3D n=1 Tax=Dictyocaulus viviparus TaxID=29172 RepID=A0A0D8Y142_DICVI|nr:hypothetical protein DICVIV_05557 [Dictyocaulus viviparus]